MAYYWIYIGVVVLTLFGIAHFQVHTVLDFCASTALFVAGYLSSFIWEIFD